NHHTVSKLLIGLGVRHGYFEGIRKTHQSGAFTRCEPPRVPALPAAHQDFGTVFVIASRKRARDGIPVDQSESETIAGFAMFFRVGLEVAPQLVTEHVFCMHLCLRPGCVRLLRGLGTVLRMKNRFKPRTLGRQLEMLEFEAYGLPEADDQD